MDKTRETLVAELLRSQTGCGDATLVKYILSLAKEGRQHFQKELKDFPPLFIEKLFTTIQQSTVYNGSVESVQPFGVIVNVSDLNKSGVIVNPETNLYHGQSVEVTIESSDNNKLSLRLHSTPSAEDTELYINKRVPRFLQHEVGIDDVLGGISVGADKPRESAEGWLGKSARITSGKVSEATSNSRKTNSSIPKVIPHTSATSKKDSNQSQNTTVGTGANLPVHKYRSNIMQALAASSVIVVVGDTGSGKTTQITQFLVAAGYSENGKIVACTQPRRLAAISIARRVSEEMGCKEVGAKVGYSVRFDDCTSPKTELKFMTDGILQREIISDPDLSKYSAIMLDEAHERTIATDVLFALLKSATARRPDLKVIVTSATLDAKRFANYFGSDVPVLRIPGRTFPVDIHWADEPVLDYMEAALATVKQIHSTPHNEGDILVFLTGQAEIDLAVSTVLKAYPDGSLIPVPVYAAIPSEMQSLIFRPAPAGKRKVVFATNIAETSLTIDGIKFVVDPGFSKVQVWDANKGMGILQIQAISQAQANQRSGRAGRTAPGTCFRLYTEQSFELEMPKSTVPEIQRDNLGHTVLGLKAMGIKDVMNFDFIDKPSRMSMMASMHELFLLGALDENAEITRMGKEMARFPLDPSLAAALISAKKNGFECLHYVLIIISMMSMPNVFYRPSQPASKQIEADRAHRQFQDITGDHITLLRVYIGWSEAKYNRRWCERNYIQYKTMCKVQEARKQLADLVINEKQRDKKFSCTENLSKDFRQTIIKCLCSGFFQNVAKYTGRNSGGGSYTTLSNNISVSVHPSSSLYKKDSKYVLYSSLMLTSKEYMHVVSEIEPDWLIDAVPDYYGISQSQNGNTNTKKRFPEEPLQPLYRRVTSHENEWKVSEHRKTLFTKRRM